MPQLRLAAAGECIALGLKSLSRVRIYVRIARFAPSISLNVSQHGVKLREVEIEVDTIVLAPEVGAKVDKKTIQHFRARWECQPGC